MTEQTWYERHINIWQRLVDIAKSVTLNSLPIFDPNYVFWGEKFAVDHFPSCFVCPLPITITNATYNHKFNICDFEYGVVVRNSDVKQGYLDALSIIGKLYDAVVADPQLGKTVCKAEPIKAYPNWRNMGTGMEAFWGGLLVRVTEYGT